MHADALIDKLRKAYAGSVSPPLPPCGWCGEDRVLATLVASYMLWESPTPRAAEASEALSSMLIDANELRVSLPDELAAILGRGSPRGLERVTRLRATLNDVYRREHAVRLAHLREKPKREARAYLDSLAEIPHFVAARTFLLGLEGHAIPVDERLLGRLLEADVVGSETATPESMSGVLERAVRAGSGAEAHALLTAWADDAACTVARPKPARRSRARAAAVASSARRSPARRPRKR